MAERTGQQAILRDFLQQWKVGSLVPERFAISSSPSLSSIARPRKRDARSYEVLPLSRKIIFMLKVQPVSGNWRPDLWTYLLDIYVCLVLRLPHEMHLCRSSSKVPRLPSFCGCCKTYTFDSLLTTCRNHQKPLLLPRKAASNFSETPVLTLLTSKCVSRHSGGHIFNISASKSAPDLKRFVHFNLEPVLCVTTPCIFLISQPTRWLRTLSEPTFWILLALQSYKDMQRLRWEKHRIFATFLPFLAPGSSFFWFFLFSDSSHLCFSICPFCRKFF